jgi:deoxyribonuclease-1
VYTGKTRSGVGAGFNDWEDMNTEHTWPRSMGAEVEPEECDLHHLFITDALTNSQRGNLPFGIVVNVTTSILHVSGGYSKLGTDSSGTTVFEPRDEHKGNVARAMTYFATQYGYTLSASELALYKAWHASDPPDDAEVTRSLAIGVEQGAANPYVVCASLLPQL